MADNKKPNKLKNPLPPVKNPRLQRWTRRPLFWIVVAIVAVTIFGQISSSANQYDKVDTSQVMAAITRGDVEAAQIIDVDQVIKIQLKAGKAINEIGRAHV